MICPLVLLAQPALGADLHVSPSGNDSNPGTAAQPHRTLTAARNAVRLMNTAMTDDIVVHLHGGEYALTQTVVFEPQDSGSGGHKVIYRAAPGETPIIKGGRRSDGELVAS